jgi:hypothetical protein
LAQFNVTMGELARMTLPSANVALGVIKSTLEAIRGVLSGGDGQKRGATVGGHAIVGTLAGAGIGARGELSVARSAWLAGLLSVVSSEEPRASRNRRVVEAHFMANYRKLFGSIPRSKAKEVPSDELRKSLLITQLLNLIELRREENAAGAWPNELPEYR